MDYKNYNPRAAALAQARTLLTDAVKAAVVDGTLPEAALPDFIVEIPADVKNGDIASNVAMAGCARLPQGTAPDRRSHYRKITAGRQPV